MHSMMNREHEKKTRPPSAAIYVTPPPQEELVQPMINLYRRTESPVGSRPHTPTSRSPTPINSRPGSPTPHDTSKTNHSFQDLIKYIGKKVSGRKTKDTISSLLAPSGSADARRVSCFLEVPKDTSHFRVRSKSLDDGSRKPQTPSMDCGAAYRIYDEILKEGRLFDRGTFEVHCFVLSMILRQLLYMYRSSNSDEEPRISLKP